MNWFSYFSDIKNMFKHSLPSGVEGPVEEVSALAVTSVDYLINDPTTPDLRKMLTLTRPPHLKYRVKGWNGSATAIGTEKGQAAICYANVGLTAAYLQGCLMDMGHQPLKGWSATSSLSIVPRAGKMLNAYYDRQGLKFFYELDPKRMKIVYTADSSDIVAHELGHALLDAIRPDFWSVQALEIWSFHEAWADITAMVGIMQHDEMLERAIKETKGDLMQSNSISRLAEEVGNTVFHLMKGRGGVMKGALRDASMRFNYINPNKLPKNAPSNKLAAECHSFGRVFLSAWYCFMVALYNHEIRNKKQPIEALKIARDAAFKILVGAVKKAPRVGHYYDVVARMMLIIAGKKYPDYHGYCKRCFSSWRIIRPQIKMLSAISKDEMIKNFEDGGMFVDDELGIVTVSRPRFIRLADHIPEGYVSAMSVGGLDLTKLEIEVPNGVLYEFGEDGMVVDMTDTQEDEMLDDARLCALLISDQNNLGPDEETMWSAENGKLVRTYIE